MLSLSFRASMDGWWLRLPATKAHVPSKWWGSSWSRGWSSFSQARGAERAADTKQRKATAHTANMLKWRNQSVCSCFFSPRVKLHYRAGPSLCSRFQDFNTTPYLRGFHYCATSLLFVSLAAKCSGGIQSLHISLPAVFTQKHCRQYSLVVHNKEKSVDLSW